MNEKKAEILVRVINATDWRDLHTIWTALYVLEGSRLGYAFREGNTWTPT